jgi:hypothetical protein
MDNIATIGAEAAANRIGLGVATKLIGHQQAYIDAKNGREVEMEMADLKAMVQRLSESNTALVAVVGGLPALPGCTIDMPALARHWSKPCTR